MLITLEGIDGTGKSSAAKMLAQELCFVFMSTPGDEYMPLRKAATRNKYSAYHYYLSACYQVSELAKSQDIVCDRYIHSTIAYNWPFSRECPQEVYAYFEGLRRPEKSFLLCASDRVRRERMTERKSQGGIISELDGDFAGQMKAQKVYESFPELVRVDTDGLSLQEVVNILVHEAGRRESEESLCELLACDEQKGEYVSREVLMSAMKTLCAKEGITLDDLAKLLAF